MVTTLYLIRHGETEGAEARRYKGTIDVPLSVEGIRQMERVSALIGSGVQKCKSAKETPELPNFRTSALAAVYTSNLSRALKSAEIVTEPHGIEPVVMPELRERSFGIWEGMSFDEIREKYPEEFDAWAGNPLKFSPMEGESTLEVRDRVIRVLDEIIERHDPPHPNPLPQGERGYKSSPSLDGRGRGGGWNKAFSEQSLYSENIAIVAHGGVNRIILCNILGIPLENIFRIEQDFAAVNIIEFHDKYPVIKLLNGGLNSSGY